MSEYAGTGSITRLVGAPPGYVPRHARSFPNAHNDVGVLVNGDANICRTVGYEEGGRLTDEVMRRPYSVVLFDEVEKGDDAVFNLFLQILDDGRLTDAKGRTVDFTNTVIIMTSNLGAHHLDDPDVDAARERVLADVRSRFRPELVNRLDEMVVFHPLSSSSSAGDGDQLLRKVARLQLQDVAARLAGNGIDLDVTDAALDVMLNETRGEVKMYGARPIKRFVQKVLVTRISKMLVREEVHEDCCIFIDADEEVKELVFTVTKKELMRVLVENPVDEAKNPVTMADKTAHEKREEAVFTLEKPADENSPVPRGVQPYRNFFLGKTICCLCDLDQFLTRIFSSPNSSSSPTPASFPVSLGFELGFGVMGSGLLGLLSRPDLEKGPAAAGLPSGGGGSPGGEGAAGPGGGGRRLGPGQGGGSTTAVRSELKKTAAAG
jgi:ATP-dependent Clp protease ATP-binding subunit ClpB